jgi:hypothetical protein
MPFMQGRFMVLASIGRAGWLMPRSAVYNLADLRQRILPIFANDWRIKLTCSRIFLNFKSWWQDCQ